MAYTFDGVDQSLTSAGADLTDAYPSTVACWARCADNSVANGMVYAIHNGVASSHRVVLRMTNTGAAAFGVLGATTSDSTGPTYQSNTWHSCIYVLTSTTSRIGYVDGSAGPAQTTDTGAVASLAETAIGVNWSSGAYADYFLGEIMNFGIWNVVLTADERAALDLGISPQLIRPGSLVFFRSLINPLNHPFLGSTLTNNNTATVSVHSRLILPANGFIGASVNTLSVAVEDSVTVGESAGMDVSNYMISVADAVTVGETTIISVGSGNDKATMLITGTQTGINNTLATLQYTSNSGYTGADTLTVVSTNLTSNVDTDTVAITVVGATSSSTFDVETLAEAPAHRRHFAQTKKEQP
jgi:hypothetical protein